MSAKMHGLFNGMKNRVYKWINPDEERVVSTEQVDLEEYGAHENSENPLPETLLMKILVLGNDLQGKEKFLPQAEENPSETVISQSNLTVHNKYMKRWGMNIRLNLWNIIPSQQRFNTVSPLYHKGIMGYVLFYNASDKSSFDEVKKLIQQIKQYNPNAPIVLVENQGNVNENAAQPVDIEAAKAFAEQRGMGYIQVNTDTNPVDNAEQVFEDLADRVLKAFQETFGLTDGSNVKKVM